MESERVENIKGENQSSLMRSDITYINGVELEKAVDIIKHCFFQKEEMELVEQEVYTVEDFMRVYTKWLEYCKFESCIDEMYNQIDRRMFYYNGHCVVCNSEQTFIVDYKASEIINGRKKLNWRERLVCPNCRCSSRERFLAYKIFEHYKPGMKILMYEQSTNLFQKIRREIPSLCGFEYPGNCYEGENEINGIHCEDVCKLNFTQEEFDFVVVNDIFSLTYDYSKAFEEAYRILNSGGKLLFTVPFDANNTKTRCCGKLTEEGFESIGGTWYYGNPIDLNFPRPVYQVFGWDILDTLKRCGFEKACGKVYYSLKEGYMGYLSVYFEAYKM